MSVLVGMFLNNNHSKFISNDSIVGFVNAGLMTLAQGRCCLSKRRNDDTWTNGFLNLSQWAPIATPGLVATCLLKIQKLKKLVKFLVGFGILFIGMSSLSSALQPLRIA